MQTNSSESSLQTEESSGPPKITRSLQKMAGKKLDTSNLETVCCPLCGMVMLRITNTHLKVHGITAADFKKLYPEVRLEPEKAAKERSAKGQETYRKTLDADPELKERIAERARETLRKHIHSASEKERERIFKKMKQTKEQKYTKEYLHEIASRGGRAAYEKHPEMYERGRKAPRSEESRRKTSERFKKLWEDPAYKQNISDKNRKAAIEGRIPLRPKHVRPTEWEKTMIAFIKKWDLPLDYTGDNRVRINISGGDRKWRNPDFMVRGQKKVVLLDAYWNKHQSLKEESDYRIARLQVLRVIVTELTDEEWLLMKLTRFIQK